MGQESMEDLISRMLRNELARRLREALEPVMKQVIDEALASLETTIKHHKDQMNLRDIFDVTVEQKMIIR